MFHRQLFIVLFAIVSFQFNSCFVLDAIEIIEKLGEYSIKINEITEGSNEGTDQKLDTIKGKLDTMSEKMDNDLRQILTNQQIAPLLNKFWALRIKFKGKMDAIYRDIPRNLTDVESSAIANSVIGDSDDSIHQLIQKIHDTLFTHDNGALFNYVTENIQFVANRKKVPADKLIFDLYLGIMSLEMKAAIGLEFQFDVFKHVHPTHNQDRRRIEKNNAMQRIQVTKSKFEEYLKKKKFHVKKETFNIGDTTNYKNSIYLGQLKADPGYVISDFKLSKVVTTRNAGRRFGSIDIGSSYSSYIRDVFWYPEIKQSKLDKYGVIDPTTSSWKSFETCQERTPLKDLRFVNQENSIDSSNSNALTGISMIRESDGSVQVKKNHVKFEVKTGALGKKSESFTPSQDSCAEVKAADKSEVNSAILGFKINKSDSNLTLEVIKFDYSTLI
ncbi:uncharacterized protein LOC134832510 [Culicoides brevitarsis]|uniref:uncharacterized protein LOC134832510 n=1 Tax=Culicoides brevitarsis TaxID=469753 RepID=UPI00307B8849